MRLVQQGFEDGVEYLDMGLIERRCARNKQVGYGTERFVSCLRIGMPQYVFDIAESYCRHGIVQALRLSGTKVRLQPL